MLFLFMFIATMRTCMLACCEYTLDPSEQLYFSSSPPISTCSAYKHARVHAGTLFIEIAFFKKVFSFPVSSTEIGS